MPASAAHADDIYEIDERLMDAGFEQALTEAVDAADSRGVRVQVDFLSESTDEAEYEQQAAEIARLVWLHLDGRVLAVDVRSTSSVSWAPESLPPAVSFSSGELGEAHGDRPDGLDDRDLETLDDAFGPESFGYAGGFGPGSSS